MQLMSNSLPGTCAILGTDWEAPCSPDFIRKHYKFLDLWNTHCDSCQLSEHQAKPLCMLGKKEMKWFHLSSGKNDKILKSHSTKITLEVTSIPVMKLPALFSYLLLVSWNKAKWGWNLNEHWKQHTCYTEKDTWSFLQEIDPLFLDSYIPRLTGTQAVTFSDVSESKSTWTEPNFPYCKDSFLWQNLVSMSAAAKLFTLSTI